MKTVKNIYVTPECGCTDIIYSEMLCDSANLTVIITSFEDDDWGI